jgi:hypothetical protein
VLSVQSSQKERQFHENEHDGRHKYDEKLNQDNDNQDEMSYNLRTYMVNNGLTALSSFLIIEISLAPGVGVTLVGIFHEQKFIQTQKRTTGDIFILECERDNKDGLSSFQAQAVKINKLLFYPV